MDHTPPRSRPEETVPTMGSFRAPVFAAPTDEILRDQPLPSASTNPDPLLAGRGPAEFTTYTGIVKWPTFVWDVNCYYRDLGVPFWATKKEMREAYQASGGEGDLRKTYVLKQLLNDEVRRRYDATEYGSIFMDDVLIAHVKQVMQDDAAKAMAAGNINEDDYTDIDLTDQLGKSIRVIDKPLWEDHNFKVGRWPWGYYLWQSGSGDTYKLRKWQELLIRNFAERRETAKIAVGFLGAHGAPWDVRAVGARLVVFLNEREEPTHEMAALAVNRVVIHRSGQQAPQQQENISA